jgi:hypothetical protein
MEIFPVPPFELGSEMKAMIMMDGSGISLLGTICLEALVAAFLHAPCTCMHSRSCDDVLRRNDLRWSSQTQED